MTLGSVAKAFARSMLRVISRLELPQLNRKWEMFPNGSQPRAPIPRKGGVQPKMFDAPFAGRLNSHREVLSPECA
jgi:hypothetical protein